MTPPATTREEALNTLLGSLFSADELRVHLTLKCCDELVKALPGMVASPTVLFSSTVDVLKRRGFIDRDFFDNLQSVFPKRISEIRKVRARWLHNPTLDRDELWAEGRYKLDSACGQGGFGLVWKAVDTKTGLFVALKILLEHHSDDRRFRQRFFRGAQVLSELSHDAIVRVRSGVEQEGLRFFYVMDFIEGANLHALLGERPRAELLKYVLQIGDALAHLHARDLIHRDVKPSNILVTSKGQAKLIDFDLVTGDAYSPMTTRGLGTAIYAPPEASASDKKSAAYDVFSLARTVETVLRGREPNIAEQLAPDPVATLDTSNTIKEILRAALRTKPIERTQSVVEFCTDLYRALTPKIKIRRDTPIREAAHGIAQGETVRQAQRVARTKAREEAARHVQANGAVVEADSPEKVAFQAPDATEKPDETARRAQEAAGVKAEPVSGGPHISDDEAASRRISRIIIGTPAFVLLIVIFRITLWSTASSITAPSSPKQTAQSSTKPIQVESPSAAEDHQGNQAEPPETSHSASEEAPIESSNGASPVAPSPSAKTPEATNIVAKKGKTVARKEKLTISPPLTQALLMTQLNALRPDEIQCFREKKAELGTEVKFIIKVPANGKVEAQITSRDPGTEAYCILDKILNTPISTPPMTDVTLQHTSTYLIW